MSQEKSKIPVSYFKADNCKTVYANGAYGGPGPRGDFLVSFFIEKNHVPEAVNLELDEKGKVVGEEPVVRTPKIDREVQVTVVLAPAQAKSIGEWLIRHADSMLGIKKGNEAQ